MKLQYKTKMKPALGRLTGLDAALVNTLFGSKEMI